MIKGYVDNKLFITSNKAATVRFALEQQVEFNGATKASYFYPPTVIFNQYDLIGGCWILAQ